MLFTIYFYYYYYPNRLYPAEFHMIAKLKMVSWIIMGLSDHSNPTALYNTA